ncbi:RNA-binding domain-containing protein [uncultured Clostridium sp.]|jgi:predicted HTH transcriptional regulator|uniref:AlbA family DNA-binding domain-containing protein n=1 Tax=uncultured Clostridium sp. TaxID=59620 RepID=UPI00260D8FBB|nr:RNA-binding domain-containing protein [uncultured Clostridium sp.]
MDIKKLLRIIRKNEGSKLDFKEQMHLNTESDKKEFTKDICAIANSKGGRGHIIVGIQDKSKKIVGIENYAKLNEERMQQIISSRCDPPIPISVEEFIINMKKILVITIFDGEQKPYQVKETGAFYIRRGSITDYMRKSELLNVFQDKLDLNIETCAIMNSNESLLDNKSLSKYFNSKGIEFNEKNRDFLLSSSNIVRVNRETGEKICTLGGLLVFSQINSIAIPYNFIKIGGEDKKEIYIQGSLLTMIDKASEYIKMILPDKYPCNAIIEAVKNAVLYRDYTLSNCIEVIIEKEEVTVKNPGKFIENSDKYMLDYSKRNMWIYEKLITLDTENRFIKDGQGFKRMNKELGSLGKMEIIESKSEEMVKVIFPGIESF